MIREDREVGKSILRGLLFLIGIVLASLVFKDLGFGG